MHWQGLWNRDLYAWLQEFLSFYPIPVVWDIAGMLGGILFADKTISCRFWHYRQRRAESRTSAHSRGLKSEIGINLTKLTYYSWDLSPWCWPFPSPWWYLSFCYVFNMWPQRWLLAELSFRTNGPLSPQRSAFSNFRGWIIRKIFPRVRLWPI